MSRRNNPQSLEAWNTRKEMSPFRASIPNGICWEFDRPGPHLISAMKVCPGGRILCAFSLSEVRDYFVDGHADQGARPEPDLAEKAASKAPPQTSFIDVSSLTLDGVIEALREARESFEKVTLRVRKEFNDPALEFIEKGDLSAAAAIRASMPDTVEKILLTDTLRKAAPEMNFNAVDPAPLTSGRALALLSHQKLNRVRRSLENRLEEILWPMARDMASEGRNADLDALAERIPGCVTKALLMDFIRQSRTEEKNEYPEP